MCCTFLHFSYWDEIHKKVVSRLRPHFAESQILRAVGVLDVNSYELHCSPSGCGFRAIFGVGVLLSHSCVPNVTILFSRRHPFTAKFVASTDIRMGTEVVIYLQTLHST